MVKLFELSETARKALVSEVSELLSVKYHVDVDSINEFWATLNIGVHTRQRA